jgi:hypothetical protein
MIYLNREIKSAFNVDPDLVVDYKSVCDRYLVNIHRNLTKQLVFYKVYYDLQQVNNSYFAIIDKLMNDEYEFIEQLNKDYAKFVNSCTVFERNSRTIVPENVMELVEKDVEKLKLAVDKLLYIVKNLCLCPEEKDEVRTFF